MKRKVETASGYEKYMRVSGGANAGLVVLFVVLALLCVIPLYFVIVISLSSEASIAKHGFSFFPSELSRDAYDFLWKNRNMLFDATKISLLVTAVGVVVGLMLTTSMGYVISRNFYLKGFFTTVVFIPMIFNGGLISSYFINKTVYRLGDTVWALILPLLVSSFNVVICKTYFKTSLPDSVVESAQIDGASQLRIYLQIVLPISLPLLATISLFLVFGYWNDWWLALLYITKPEVRPLQSLLNSIERNVEYLLNNALMLGISRAELREQIPRESFRMAIAVVIILPISCAYPFFQRYFISGLTIGAIKG